MVLTPLILARGRKRQRQAIEFEARLVYIANSRLGGATGMTLSQYTY